MLKNRSNRRKIQNRFWTKTKDVNCFLQKKIDYLLFNLIFDKIKPAVFFSQISPSLDFNLNRSIFCVLAFIDFSEIFAGILKNFVKKRENVEW